MNESQNKPRVAPPAAYKAPSLPTLAALGAISAAALVGGCATEQKHQRFNDIELGGICIMILDEPAETQTPPAEKAPENIPEGGDVFIGEIPAQ